MGKYIKKSKINGDFTLIMEVSPQSPQGVRTRASSAKTLAFQRLHKPSSLSNPKSSSASSDSYLQLRSRRLEKPPLLKLRQKAEEHSIECCKGSLNPLVSEPKKKNLGGESRSTAKNIPSSLVRESGTIGISDSRSKQMSSHITGSRVEMELCRSIPTSNEIEEFFAHEELWHQKTFAEKYNFDFTNEMPLQGRYEWVQMVL